jgi:hypothetical protein
MEMPNQPEIKVFLESSQRFGSLYNAVIMGEHVEPLSLSFWSPSEIENCCRVKSDWQVDEHLLPFYGDWHDLFCLDLSSTPISVVCLNDERSIRFRWVSISHFESSLVLQREQKLTGSLGIIKEKSRLDF